MKTKKKKTMTVVGIALIIVLIFFAGTFVPVQRAIFPEDLSDYDNVIVVQYGLGPPTDFMMIGNSEGLFESPAEEWIDVSLLGNIPPGEKYSNDFEKMHTQYVCFVEYKGKQTFLDQGLIDTYTVSDWAPLGPIDRGNIPSCLAPRNYTCLWDIIF